MKPSRIWLCLIAALSLPASAQSSLTTTTSPIRPTSNISSSSTTSTTTDTGIPTGTTTTSTSTTTTPVDTGSTTTTGSSSTSTTPTAVDTEVLTQLNLFPTAYPNLSSGQKSVADVISEVCPQGIASKELQNACNHLVGESSASVQQGAIGQITPDQLSSATRSTQSATRAQQANIASRLAALRAGAKGFTTSGLVLNPGRNTDPQRVLASLAASGQPLTGGNAGDELPTNTPWGGFANISWGRLEHANTAEVEGFDGTATALSLGLDYRVRDDLVLGAALGYQTSSTDLDRNGGDLDIDGYSLSLYGSYSKQPWYVDGYISTGRNAYQQARNVDYTLSSGDTVSQRLAADYDGQQLGAGLRVGYPIQHEAWTFEPHASLDYLKLKLDSYQEHAETGDGAWAAGFDSQDYQSLESSLGISVSYASSQAWGVLIPQASAAWIHEFKDDSRTVLGYFAGDPSQTRFTLPMDTQDSNYFNLSLGATAVFSDGRSAYVNVQKLLGYDDLDLYTINAGIRVEF